MWPQVHLSGCRKARLIKHSSKIITKRKISVRNVVPFHLGRTQKNMIHWFIRWNDFCKKKDWCHTGLRVNTSRWQTESGTGPIAGVFNGACTGGKKHMFWKTRGVFVRHCSEPPWQRLLPFNTNRCETSFQWRHARRWALIPVRSEQFGKLSNGFHATKALRTHVLIMQSSWWL